MRAAGCATPDDLERESSASWRSGGPILARRLRETLLRWAVAILGFTLAVILLVGSFG